MPRNIFLLQFSVSTNIPVMIGNKSRNSRIERVSGGLGCFWVCINCKAAEQSRSWRSKITRENEKIVSEVS